MIEKISTRQEIFVLTISRIATVITIMPIIHMGPANQDIWLIVIAAFFYTFLLDCPMMFLMYKFSDLTIVGYMEKIFGKFIGKIIAIFYGILFIRTAVLFFYIAIQMIRTTFMTELPPIVTISVLMILCLYATTRGLEVLGRAAELFGPIIIVSIIIFAALGFNNIDITVFLPIYSDSSFLTINRGAIELCLVVTDIYVLTMNMPQLERKEDMVKIIIKATAYSLLVILVMLIATQSSLGVEQAKHSNYPFLTYVRMVRTYSIFERIEAAFLVVWTVTIVTRIIAYLYIASYAFKEIFKEKNTNTFAYPICIIAGIITYYLAEINPMMGEIIVLKLFEYTYYLVCRIGIPILAVIVYFFRRKSFEKQERLPN